MNPTMHTALHDLSLHKHFANQDHQLAIQAALAGEAQSQLFTPAGAGPDWAVLWVCHRVFLGGPPETKTVDTLRAVLSEEIAPAARARGDKAFVLYYPPEWNNYRVPLLAQLPYSPSRRYYYAGETLPASEPGRDALPPGLRLAAVDADLLERTELVNYERLAQEMCSERPSVDDFLQRSFSVCLLDGDTLTGWCLSEYNCGSRCEVGIEVVEDYQRRGLGTTLARALAAEAARRGIDQMGWHCAAHNTASAATARHIGLRLVREYPAAIVWLRQD